MRLSFRTSSTSLDQSGVLCLVSSQIDTTLLIHFTGLTIKFTLGYRQGGWVDSNVVLRIGLWGYYMALSFLPAFIPLLFITLPISITLEIALLTLVIYVAILPTVFGAWGSYGFDALTNL